MSEKADAEYNVNEEDVRTVSDEKRRLHRRVITLTALMAVITVTSTQMRADTGTCGGAMTSLPFGDVPNTNIFFCSIAEAYFSALTNGTDATHYSPSAAVPREQMAAFVTRTMDQSVRRSSKRAALNQYWTTHGNSIAFTVVGNTPLAVQSDGADLWVANRGSGTVTRVRASDGKLLETWTGATQARGVLCAMGKVLVIGETNPGSLYGILPTEPAGPVTTISNGLGANPQDIGFDGQRIWTANNDGSVSIINLNPASITTVSSGFNSLEGVIYDGSNIWVTDIRPVGFLDKLHKLDSTGGILQSVDGFNGPFFPAFDGTNIWVPNSVANTVMVVRATGNLGGTVLATLSGNGLNGARRAAFDGERILVTNNNGDSISLWNASDFTPIGTFSTGAGSGPYGACSDGLNFWITTIAGNGKLARF